MGLETGVNCQEEPIDETLSVEPSTATEPSPFATRYAKYCGVLKAPPDLSTQHEHYRRGTPKR